MNDMIKTLKMFEFGSWEDATSRTSKMPTTTKRVDRAKKDDNGKMFVRCRLVARDFKPKREGPRGDATVGSEEGFIRVCCKDA